VKKYLLLTLLVVVAMVSASFILAGDQGTAKDNKAANTSTEDKACAKICKDKAACTTDKAACATDKTACTKDKAACAKACTNADGKAKGQCSEACKAKCKDKAACTKHASGTCNPKDCKPGTCDPKECKGQPKK